MLPGKIFAILHTIMVILAFFDQFSGKVCSYFWPLTLSALSNIKYDAFCSHSFDYACLRRLRFIVMNRGANLC